MKLLELAVLLKPNYVEDWYHVLLSEPLQRCAAGDPNVPNLLISSPPGSGKTELIGIRFPTYIFSHDRDAHVIALANSDSLACLASGNVLRLVQHPKFQERWQLALDKASASRWTIAGNDGRPSMIAAGISGGVIGHRADYLIFDDLIKSQSDAYSETVRERTWANFSSAAETRLLPDGKIIGIQTRWHLDDVHGRLLRRAQEDRQARQFVYVSLAAWKKTQLLKALPKMAKAASSDELRESDSAAEDERRRDKPLGRAKTKVSRTGTSQKHRRSDEVGCPG